MVSSSSSPPMTTASKRHSLMVSTGPRPLHLVDGNVLFLQGPATAPLPELSSPPSSSKPTTFTRPHARRQSSISYHTKDRNTDRDVTVRSPLSSGTSRNSSAGPKSSSPVSILPTPSPRDRRSGYFDVNSIQERPPLTLAEKHSELLHFIAQKESKCLELRSQLSLHEAELLQLKRKWERIISRSFETPGSDPSTTTQGSGAVLEGIREGVQGVSRFITAGLAISELSPMPPPSPVPRLVRPTHSSTQSNSSTSTFATKSTRFSQSSASSLGEDPPPVTPSSGDADEDTVQILMVHDTGATPTMSPNPVFMHQQQQREEQQQCANMGLHAARSNFETEQGPFVAISTAKMHRRKSRDAHVFGEMLSAAPRAASPSKDMDTRRSEAIRAKRASINGAGFPPVSSIPGLGSLTVGTAPPVSSWVGSVGKKWEELQRGSTFSKNQKRASVLLSDVSQSIAAALSPQPLSASSSKSASPVPPSYFSPQPLMSASTTTTSLLDDDDDDTFKFVSSSSIMIPAKSKPAPEPTPARQTPGLAAKLQPKHPPPLPMDEEEEWNW